MTKKNILKIVIPSAIALIAATIFCGAYYGSVYEEYDYPDIIGHSEYCTHPIDQEYIEPTVTLGKYYLNGDINSCYIEVTESTWQIVPSETCDLEKVYGEIIRWSDEAPADPATAPDADATPTLTEERIKFKENAIAFYSKPHEYTVVTWHPVDKVFLCSGPADSGSVFDPPKAYWEGERGYNGPVLENEKTIRSFGGDYILIE